MGNLGNLSADNPTFDFTAWIINGSVYAGELLPDIHGRIWVDGEEVNQQPEFIQIEVNNTIRSLQPGADWTIERNLPARIVLHQHLLPTVAEKLRGRAVSLSFSRLDIGVRLVRRAGSESELGPRQRLPLPNAYTLS